MFSVVHAEHELSSHNLAFDEALVRAEPAEPVLWLWRNPGCVVLGRAQHAEREVDLASCARDAVPVLRRGSGGGTVYHDLGNLNITLILPGAGAALAMLRAVLCTTIRAHGLAARVTGRGLFVGDAKLCGFAALRTRGAALAHASLLESSPPERVTRYLTPTPASRHPLDSERSPVTSLAALGVAGDPRSLVLDAVGYQLGAARHRMATGDECAHRERLMWSRYSRHTWHLTGKRKEDVWTSRPASTFTA